MKKILLLEDEEVLANMYQKKLSQAGHQVIWTRTPEEAAQKSQEFGADIVVLDHGIKGHEISGLDALPSIRKMLPKAWYIMLSNYSRSQLEEEGGGEGADDYLLKIDTSPTALLEYINQL